MKSRCPKCELNYVREGEKLCDVCLKDMKKTKSTPVPDDVICPECGENVVMKGRELCMDCFIEKKKLDKTESANSDDDNDNIIAIEDLLDGDDIPDEEIEIVESGIIDDELRLEEA